MVGLKSILRDKAGQHAYLQTTECHKSTYRDVFEMRAWRTQHGQDLSY